LEPGFNIFSKQQDVEIGRESAAQAEQQLPILQSGAATQMIENVTSRLVAAIPNSAFSYRPRVVNVSDVNAFALPGGYLYVNRGLIEAADSEGQLAGVIAHEIGHIALRHGTNQASKAYIAQAGLSILGGIIGGNRSNTDEIVNALGGFGLNALFLKYSRDDESEADAFGAKIMADAGYDPLEMADFFEKLRQAEARDPSELEQFFSDHPAPADRAEHIRAEAGPSKPASARQSSALFTQAASELRSAPRAPSMQQLASGQPAPGPSVPTDNPSTVQVEAPSSSFSTFTQRDRIFSIDYPSNWQVYGSSGYGVSIVPAGGVLQGANEPVIVYGVVLNHYMPVDASSRLGGMRSSVRPTSSWPDCKRATHTCVPFRIPVVTPSSPEKMRSRLCWRAHRRSPERRNASRSSRECSRIVTCCTPCSSRLATITQRSTGRIRR
jgi:hypothetical protein